jgi:hypothetical protein
MPLAFVIRDYTWDVGEEDELKTAMAHASWGAPHCRGHLVGMIRGDEADIVCDECSHVVCSMAAADLQAILSQMEHTRLTTIPHSSFGDEECCGCLDAVIDGDQAVIQCNECNAVIRNVPVADLERTLTEMELTLDCCSEMCPHCGSVNVISGFSQLMAYTCQNCGEVVRLSDDPDVGRFFGRTADQ